MLNQNFFYHSSIKKYLISFSHIINDIHVQRTEADGTLVKDVTIPITYAQKTKLFNILQRNSNIDRKVSHFLPRIDFELTTITPDSTRQKNVVRDIDVVVDDDVDSIFNGIAYNFGVEVTIITQYLDDLYQALEQVLASFTPDYQNLVVDLIPELNIAPNIKVVLTGVETDITTDMDEDSYRSCEANLTFEMQGYLYKPIQTGPKIRQVILDLDDSETDKTWSTLTATLESDDTTITETITDYDQ